MCGHLATKSRHERIQTLTSKSTSGYKDKEPRRMFLCYTLHHKTMKLLATYSSLNTLELDLQHTTKLKKLAKTLLIF